MTVQVNIRQIGQRKQTVQPIPFELSGTPQTVRELITQTVTTCVREYEKRQERSGDIPAPLTAQQITDMSDIGKIAFGINYGEKKPDLQKAVENALQAFEDGIYRVFINDKELSAPDEKIEICEGDTLTFIKLTLLAGRMY